MRFLLSQRARFRTGSVCVFSSLRLAAWCQQYQLRLLELARRRRCKVIALSRQSGPQGLQMLQLLQSRLPEGVHWHALTLEALPIAAFTLVSVGMILKFAVPPFQPNLIAQILRQTLAF